MSKRDDGGRPMTAAEEALITQNYKMAVLADSNLKAAKAREAAMVTALVKAGIPLEVLAAQIAEKPYGELTEDLQILICATVFDIRAALAGSPVPSREAKVIVDPQPFKYEAHDTPFKIERAAKEEGK